VAAAKGLTNRLWRVRRRHHHIDAVLRQTGSTWRLTFLYDDGELMTWRFDRRKAADAEASRRLADLQRAGWTVHW
jgi:hypothetical protein